MDSYNSTVSVGRIVYWELWVTHPFWDVGDCSGLCFLLNNGGIISLGGYPTKDLCKYQHRFTIYKDKGGSVLSGAKIDTVVVHTAEHFKHKNRLRVGENRMKNDFLKMKVEVVEKKSIRKEVHR